MNEQTANISRVSASIAPHICHFLESHLNQEFHADDLRQYVSERTMIAPGSADRILRDLRAKGICNYVVVNRAKSLYRALPVRGQLNLF